MFSGHESSHEIGIPHDSHTHDLMHPLISPLSFKQKSPTQLEFDTNNDYKAKLDNSSYVVHSGVGDTNYSTC